MESEDARTPRPEGRLPAQAARRGAAVLVVDDDEPVARQLADGLRALGHRVQAVGSASEALRALAKDEAIVVMVTDIRMPGGDGLSLARQVSEGRDDARAVEMVIITGHATLDDATAAMRTGVCDFLPKPFRLREIGAAVDRAMGRATQRRLRAAEGEKAEKSLRELEVRLVEAHDRLGRLIQADGGQADHEAAAELAAISHALRTPLHAVVGGTELLGPGPGGTRDGAGMSLLRDGLAETLDAVESLEALHRLRRVRAPSTRDAVEMTALLDGAIAEVAQSRGDRITAEWEGATAGLRAVGDPVLLRQAVRSCLLCIQGWCGEGRQLGLRLSAGDGPEPILVLTFTGSRAGAPPAQPVFDESQCSTGAPRTIEDLRFLAARHVARLHGGRLESWEGPRAAALRLALPAFR